MEKKNENVIMVTDKGIIGTTKDTSMIIAMLMYAFLNVWDDNVFKIDIEEAGMKIVDLLNSMHKEEGDDDNQVTFFDLISEILNGDDTEEN